jgi:uncharacterized protein (TIGR02147 family)
MNIFGYYNYRKYLEDFYDYKKSTHRYFSYRSFARKAGYSSSGLYLDLVKGRKNLTPKILPKFAEALGLSEKESKYFALMIDYTHAATWEAKQDIFEKMSAMLPRSLKQLSRNQREYYDKWYFVAVREALSVVTIKENYRDLALFLNPRITLPQAKASIKLLSELELIEKINGFWRPSTTSISSGGEIDPIMIHAFQKQMIDLSKASLDNHSREKRNISCTTMSVSAMGLERIIHKIDTFRKEVIDIVRSDEKEAAVYQLNVQFYPLSKELVPEEASNE